MFTINKVEEGTSIYTTTDPNSDSLRTNHRENNGYHSGHSILLDSERITFTWSEINVFTLGRSKTKMGLLFKGRNNQMPSQGKQILKNGKIYFSFSFSNNLILIVC